MRKYGKHTLWGWSWRTLLWVVLTPFFLLFLLAVLIYLPPVQKWAVDRAAEVLSEETGLEMTVGHVCLKFPLDLSLGDVVALQEGDTVFAARELDVSVRALPLLELKAEVDGIHLYDVRLDTRGLVEAAVIRGRLAELSLASHHTDMKEELAVVSRALLRDADLTVLLNDSVPEDTTESEVKWRVQLDDVELQNVGARVLLSPQVDSTYVAAHIPHAHAAGLLDLGAEVYSIYRLEASDMMGSFDLMKEPRQLGQLDPFHLSFNKIALVVDSFEYRGTGDMAFDLTHLSGVEQSGLSLEEVRGRVEMDSLALRVPQLHVRTADSDLTLAYRMDMTAFDDFNPGTFALSGVGQIGKGDIIYFTRMGGEDTKDVCALMAQQLPVRPVEVTLRTVGNLQTLAVEEMRVKVPGMLVADGEAMLWDVADNLSLRAQVDVADGNGGSLQLDGSYVADTESYKADVDFRHLDVNRYVSLDDRTLLSGKASMSGRGFDFLSPSTLLDASVSLSDAWMGQMNLSNMDADVSLQGSQLTLALTGDNEQLQTAFTFDGMLKRQLVEGVLNIELPWADLQAMGFSDETLTARTSGQIQFSYNLDNLFRVDADIDALQLHLAADSITTDAFHLYAEAQRDTTSAVLRTGDLDFTFFAPANIFQLIPKVERFQQMALKQFKQRDVDIDALKAYLPTFTLHAAAGKQNPLTDILAMYGISFHEFVADVEASPVQGLLGKGHVYAFKKDSVRLDTAFFDLAQDSTRFNYHVGLQCSDQPLLPAFRANLDGYLKADEVDAHLTYFDKKGRQGVDLGVKGMATDSCVNFSLYPERPVLAYREFTINADNYIVTRPGRPILADIRLASTSDSSYVALLADENAAGLQIANIMANDLNLQELLTVVPIPGLPSMGGILHLDATYIERGDNFLVEGQFEAGRFSYEGMDVGNLASRFTYTPQGENLHLIDASLAYNGKDVLQLDGTYNAEDEGILDADLAFRDVPMQMFSAFIPDQMVGFTGTLAGNVKVAGPVSAPVLNGDLLPHDIHVVSRPYSLDLALANDSIRFRDSRVDFADFKFYGADDNPLTLNGYVDFAKLDEIFMSLSLTGRNFKLIGAKPARQALLYGDLYGDFFTRVIGSTRDLTVRGLVRVLPTTNLTYVMTETALYQTDRLEDIVTFVDFNAPPPPIEEIPRKTFMGIDMNVVLSIEDGAKLNGEFSADKQSYVNVQGGGSLTLTYTPEGVLGLQGRYTINEGEMKYTLPVIPLKTFTIHSGSYIEFAGDPTNPVLNISATERVKATVGESDGTSRSVTFDTGLRLTNTLSDMGLEFTIEAPEDIAVQNELASISAEEKNKLAVGMLATGMYLSGSNRKGFTAGNALNSFLQNEINNIAGRAMSTMVEVNVGMEQTTRDDGTTRTDYSFRFSRRFFSDRLNVIIGGKVSADNSAYRKESGTYIDDVSLEWRLDNGGTQYIRLFHERDFSNLIEGQIDKNGAGILLRRKVDHLSELLIWRKKNERPTSPDRPTSSAPERSDPAEPTAAPESEEPKQQ